MPKTIFDYVNAPELTAYWEILAKDMPPYLGEILFPAKKKLGLDLRWIKGAAGTPVVLKPSAYDVGAVPRPRIGFSRLSTQMPFFKESTYVDEELRQELNKVLETGNTAYIQSVMNRVFDDEMQLINGARARREQMRMMALTTGTIAIEANGQKYDYDYGIPADHKATVTTSWSDATADIIGDIRTWQDQVESDTGVRPTRAVCDSTVWTYLRKNTDIQKILFPMTTGGAPISDSRIKDLLKEELELEVTRYTKVYTGDDGSATKFIPADTFVLMPPTPLGNTWFGTTPEESDLMASNAANVSIVDTGVAITTIQKTDPVNVETKASMICLPSFEAADQIFIADVIAS